MTSQSRTGGHSTSGRSGAIDVSKYLDVRVYVRLLGGRQVSGILRGWDPLVNLVLDEAVEQLRDPEDPYKTTDKERKLGLVVIRGTSLVSVYPVEGAEEIVNPFETASS
ncbi:U6 snRNA-associated Sm-like protein LSm7 [Galdieria sulphuraria]|uniref:U6 snRNA-associated Sm-like protein LSm7 n=1 Tax=Galdieria sulphuraria TaxID=130081 RepID=M2XZX7_GALSU|nr:U6 snRNA-associated Sm-like protein LSm7 [Galdieria sulphuraria]EME29139.1 U6 snRNA-associated Sm-like protein LSm7 [Galdieria sulphuraria]|eukprot:XP_005705659.1 U6 snRNA-associated Sm-like protein LSm7 [Galdieria sulphuraria]